jgi:hypothetical protein
MTANTFETLTSTKSIASLIDCWTAEAARQNASPYGREFRAEYGNATAEGVGASMYSDTHKDLHGVRFVPCYDSLTGLAESYARLWGQLEAEAAAEANAKAEGEARVAEAREPSPAFTMADAFSALA